MQAIICVTFIIMLVGVTSAYISCSLCDGSYVYSNLGTGCVAAVREKCPALGATSTWKRGVFVKDNCNTIPTRTAIATFHGAGATYNSGTYKHAAIFIKCVADGLEVHDQWEGSGGCKLRTIRYSGTGVNGGNNFWTID